MKIKAGNKVYSLFEKKPNQQNKTNFYQQTNPIGGKTTIKPQPNFRPSTPFSAKQGTSPQSPLMRGISGSSFTAKKEKQSMTKTLSKIPTDELAAYASIIVGFILIFIAIIIW